MPNAVTFIDSMDIEDIRNNILQRMNNRAERLRDDIQYAQTFLDRSDAQNTSYKIAFLEAARYVSESIREIVQEIILRSCVETVEYDYEPYVSRLLTAVRLNLDNIITYIPDESSRTVFVEVNFDYLGTPEEWMSAVEQTRELLQVGEYGGNSDPALRSHMWAEKIYGVDREGKSVMRRRKKDGEPYDVTEKFEGKYYNTILTRLSFVPRDKAPFWYFINYGSINFGGDGDPYPDVQPTGMVDILREYIQELFRDALYEFESQAERALSELIFPDENISDTDYVDDFIDENIDDLLTGARETRVERTALDTLEEIEVVYKSFIRRGKFVTAPFNLKTQRFVKRIR